MKAYEQHLQNLGISVRYIASDHQLADIRQFGTEITRQNIAQVHVIDPVDDWLEQRLEKSAQDIELVTYTNPQFINSKDDLSKFFRSDKKSFFQTSFYKQQRKTHGILLDDQGQPEGGKWTFDTENRKKYPKDKTPPAVQFPEQSAYWSEAIDYIDDTFSDNPGKISKDRLYPITHQEASDWLDEFLTHRFQDFGIYEDAIVREASILNHSVLSPLINAGLILPMEVVDRSLSFAEREQIPINSIEGFIRQIIGWREFIRGMYVCKGRFSRTRNFWNFDRKIPEAFYDGTTGIDPIDVTINKVLQTGYCHHIERLMVLGNFMLLCEFDPDEVYRWFMELFIDAYDWVMVPNIYGMSQFADGGTFATKPYVGGANYIRKMSNYPKGDWEDTWNGLFWRFIHKHEQYFRSNQRTSMLVHTYHKMSDDRQRKHLANAESFIESTLS